jgi:hypothetical protein
VRKRTSFLVSAVAGIGMLAALLPAGRAAAKVARPDPRLDQNLAEFFAQHRYMPLSGVANYYKAQDRAASWAAAHASRASATPASPGRTPEIVQTPTVGASWQGIADSQLTPPDTNGAIGPNSYLEIVNDKVGIYTRTGNAVSTGNLSTLTGDSGFLSDPTELWDPHTQRFYFSLFRAADTTFSTPRIDWGFSKSANPTDLTSANWCHYQTNFGWVNGNIPDYPKLGQTQNFLLVGVNFYKSINSSASEKSQLLWMRKPQAIGTITTCPGSPKSGLFDDLRNADTTQAFTPLPAIETDKWGFGYVTAMSDIECPPNCGTGNLLTLFTITRDSTTGDPILSAPNTINVGSYTNPAPAAQSGTKRNTLDTLDGRLTHSVAGGDPRLGHKAIWVAHTIQAGAGAGIQWFEIDGVSGTVSQTGILSDSTKYIFNAGISNDRTCDGVDPCKHGNAMVLGFTESSSSIFPTDAMVSKIGANSVSSIVVVHASTTFDKNFSCSPCRWGDYGGATPDPAASLLTATHGEVWLSNQGTTGGSIFSSGDVVWNWEAKP